MKEETKKLILLLIVIGAIVMAFVPAPIAQGIAAILAVAALVAGVALLGAGVTELLKMFLRYIFSVIKLPTWLIPAGFPKGAASAFIAAIVAFLGVMNFDVNFLSQFEIFGQVDQGLVDLLTFVMVWYGSGLWHNALPPIEGKYADQG